MRKVLIFSLAYYPSFVSGAEAAIREITDRIAPDEIKFHLITLRFDSKAPRLERIGNVTVHRVGFGGVYLSKILFIPLAALKARELHKKHSFSALWAMMTYMLLPTMLAKALGVRVPHILTLQDGDPYEKVFNRPFIVPFTYILDRGFRSAAMIQAISSYLASWPPRRGYTGSIEIIRNGANPKDFHDRVSPEDVQALRRTLVTGADDVLLVNTARLVRQKGNDTTIQALALLPARVKLVLVGSGPEEDRLRSLVRELGLESRVVFVGQVSRDKVTLYRRVADVFVGPSRSEGLGNAFLSAMASRIPVVATREGGLAEYVFEGKTAWAVHPDAPEELAAAISSVLEHPEEVEKRTAAARRMVEEEYDWDQVAKAMFSRVFAPVLKLP